MSDLPLPEPLPEQALDIQHDPEPAREAPRARHIPHLGHTLLFFSLTWTTLMLWAGIFFSLAHVSSEESARAHPSLALLTEAVAYASTLAISWWMFPRLWGRSFPLGLQWNPQAIRRRWYWLLAGGPALSLLAQAAQHFVALPKESAVERLMGTTPGAWATAAFGVLLAPLMEEIGFRGFLLSALATAYDWLLLERTPAGLQRWQSSATHSRAALAFSAIFSSLPFALLHASQLSHAWGAVGILYAVSLALSLVRIATRSLACSTLVHATYNFSLFALVFVQTGGFRHMNLLH